MLSMHDVGQMVLSVADIPLVACTPSYCAFDAKGHNIELDTHDTEWQMRSCGASDY